MRSLLSDVRMLWERGDETTFIDECGSTDLTVARAMMVAEFLKSPATEFVFIDNDVGWQSGALVRLVDHPVDFVSGVYPKRMDPLQFPVSYLDRPTLQADPETGLLELESVPGGFVRYSRDCLERMTESYAEIAYSNSRYPEKALPGFFEPMRVEGGIRMRDDLAFCRRWRDIGGKVWVDPLIAMVHVGPKAFAGNFGEWLRGRK